MDRSTDRNAFKIEGNVYTGKTFLNAGGDTPLNMGGSTIGAEEAAIRLHKLEMRSAWAE